MIQYRPKINVCTGILGDIFLDNSSIIFFRLKILLGIIIVQCYKTQLIQ